MLSNNRNPQNSFTGKFKLVTNRTQLIELINDFNLQKGAEIGVAKGEFSEHLLQNSKLETLHSIDAWSSDLEAMKAYRRGTDRRNVTNYYQEAVNRLSKFGNRSVVIKDFSENAVKNFKDEELDFIYLDASHLFSGFFIDLINWWKKLKYGGIFAGHDFIRKSSYQVIYAVNGFCMEHKQFYYLTTGDASRSLAPSWYLQKTLRSKDEWNKETEEYRKIINEQIQILNKRVKVYAPYEYA